MKSFHRPAACRKAPGRTALCATASVGKFPRASSLPVRARHVPALCDHGGITIGLSTDVPAAGATSLVEHLAQTRGIALKRDPALPFRAVSGLVGGEAFLVSDEYGIVAATNAGCAQEDAGTVAFLSAAFEKLYDAVR